MRTNETIVNRKNIVSGQFHRNFLIRMINRWQAWNRRRQAIRELRAMPDVLLRDIGIQRHEIENVVKYGGNFAHLHPVETSSAVAPLNKAAA